VTLTFPETGKYFPGNYTYWQMPKFAQDAKQRKEDKPRRDGYSMKPESNMDNSASSKRRTPRLIIAITTTVSAWTSERRVAPVADPCETDQARRTDWRSPGEAANDEHDFFKSVIFI
jgi:hypothetical protein